MRRATSTVGLCGLLLGMVIASEAQSARARAHPTVTAKAAILIDNQTGEVLWQLNPDVPLPPASTTKIVTAFMALQSGRLDDSFSVTPEAAEAQPSKIRLRPGWQMRLRDLVYAVLLNSANDASVVIAEGLAGSVRDFAERMNAQARRLGATNTHFVNPNGLPAPDHYSTARDLATMFAQAMQNPLFERIVSTKTAEVSPSVGSSRRIALHNHNRLLGAYRIHVVGKTGWTIAAKKCFVGAGREGGREVVVAVLGSRNVWRDLKYLLEYGLEGAPVPTAEVAEQQTAAAVASSSAGGDNDESDNSRWTPRYSVRLAVFRNAQNATRLRQTLAQDGYATRIEKLRHGRQHRYRVSVGSYADRHAAEQAALRLERNHPALKPLVVASN